MTAETTGLLGQRVAIFGAGGKTTLAKAIARRWGHRHIELDHIHHMPGWCNRADTDVLTMVRNAMDSAPNGWVTDHGSRGAGALIFERADTLIVLDLPFPIVFLRRVRRSLRRAWTGEEVCGGNTETFRQHLASRESAILEMWTRRHRCGGYAEHVRKSARAGVPMHRIARSQELEDFYRASQLVRCEE